MDGETLFLVTSELQNISPSERAERIVTRIKEVAEDHSQSIDSVKAEKIAKDVFVITSPKREIVILTEADAKAANQTLDKLSNDYANKIKAAIDKYRQQRSLISIILSTVYTIISLAAFIIVMRMINWLHQFNENFFRNWLHKKLQSDNRTSSTFWQWLNVIGLDLYKFFYAIQKLIFFSVILSVTYLFVPLILSFFPLTQKLSDTILTGISHVLTKGWNNFLDYLPNLFIILFTIAIIYYLNKYTERFFSALENESISLPGFYPDWAKPTYKLSYFLIIAFAVALIYPYLPGSDSASFQGISIFIGALVTIGGAGAVGNLVGGFIIIYTRSYQIGDRIKLDDIKGDVVEKTILSTRICTIDNEVVTIPNASIVGSNIINYSAAMRDFKRPLLLRTTITLGYDVPWRQVYKTLVSAAKETSNILKEPAPFVVQTSLDDYYVSYQLKAYTDKPREMIKIYSELYENIQDKCNEVGIEIMSPHYSAIRDGNQNTIPEDYLPKDYHVPGFIINPSGQVASEEISKN